MAFFNLFKDTENRKDIGHPVQGAIADIGKTIFPGGHPQVISESKEIRNLLGDSISEKESQSIWSRSKALVFLTSIKTASRCGDSIQRKSEGRLTLEQSKVVYNHACGKLGLNDTRGLTLTKHLGKLFKLDVDVIEPQEYLHPLGIFDPELRQVGLIEQHNVSYVVAFGSVLCSAICYEHPDIAKKLDESMSRSLRGITQNFDKYKGDKPSSYSWSLIHEAFGNLCLDESTWESVFVLLLETYSDKSSRDIISRLKLTSMNAIGAHVRVCKLGLLSAESYLVPNSAFQNLVPWAIASYANRVKNSHVN